MLDGDFMLGHLVFHGHLCCEPLAHEMKKTLAVIGFA